MSERMTTDIKGKGEGQTERKNVFTADIKLSIILHLNAILPFYLKALAMFWCRMTEMLQLVFHPVEKILII